MTYILAYQMVILRRLFDYYWRPIDFKYENLTKAEKDIISEDEFERIKYIIFHEEN